MKLMKVLPSDCAVINISCNVNTAYGQIHAN